MLIIGGGAAGLIASISAARTGKKVTILEQNSKIGRKISISGNGMCNISNKNISPTHFYSNNPQFIIDFLDGYGFDEVEKFFSSIGLELTEGKDGKMFPLSHQASSVIALLEYEAQSLGVEIIYKAQVTSISKDGNFLVETTHGNFSARQLLIASGSKAYPKLGGNDLGYKFAKDMGHTIVERHPSLVQLCSDEKWIKSISGVKVFSKVKLYANRDFIGERSGDVLFTDYGVSGLAILDISREVSIRLSQHEYCELFIDLMPNIDRERLIRLLLNRINPTSEKPINLWLHGVMNQKLTNIIIKQSKSKVEVENQLNKKEVMKLVYAIKNLKITINDTKGWAGAEVSTGGVNTFEVNPLTMESKIVPNLYFAGEVLDVDGDRGGFNFHFAWVSGLKIGVLKNLKT
ncbi:MAG: NAD(P)/FAD-dependent oxidoreductase [Sulfurovum sp.]